MYFWLVCTIGVLSIYSVVSIRVCPTFDDYDRLNNKRCFDNPGNQNVSEIIRSWPGFTAEEYFLTTEDGYIILVERLYSKITQKTPILVVHGISMNSLGWVYRGNVSLARLLGDQGYDVWMLNHRGSWYSKGHKFLTESQREYWKFNLNDWAIYDVRSSVKLVNEKTKRKPIYIGYSSGTTVFYIYSQTYPKEAKENIKAMIGLASVTGYQDARSIARIASRWWPLLRRIIYALWSGEILPGYSIFLRPLVNFSAGMYAMQSIANLVFGDDFDQMDALTYPQITQLVDTVPVEILSHLFQFYQTGRFAKYDYGKRKNLQIYNSPSPPLYDLSKIEVPVALFIGQNDWLATMTNSKLTYSKLQPSLRCGFHVIPHKKWNHIDYLVAKELPKYLYTDLLKKIKELDQGSCPSLNARISQLKTQCLNGCVN